MGFQTVGLLSSLATLLVAAPVPVPSDETVETHYQRARSAQERKDWETAVAEWKAITVLAPQIPEAYANLGMMYYFAHRPEAAIPAFQAALKLSPDMVGPHLFGGICYYLTSRPRDAITHLNRALSLDPPNTLARRWLGMSHLLSGEPAKAVPYLEAAQSEDPLDTELLFYLSRSYARVAMSAVEQLHALYPDSFWDRLARAEQYRVQNHPEQALMLLQPIPDQANRELATLTLARILESKGDRAEAVQAYASLLLRWPANYAAARGLATLLDGSGCAGQARRLREIVERILAKPLAASQPDAAADQTSQRVIGSLADAFLREYSNAGPAQPETAIENVIDALRRADPQRALSMLDSQTPKPPEYAIWRARALAAAGKPREAFQALSRGPSGSSAVLYLMNTLALALGLERAEDLRRSAPDGYRLRQLQAEFLLAKGDEEGAIREYRQALAQHSRAPTLHYSLGGIYASRRQYDEAIEEYRKELELDPYSAVALTRLGQLAVEVHEPAKAKGYLEQALAIDPQSGLAQKYMGMAYGQLGDSVSAIRYLESALKLTGGNDETIHFQLAKIYRQMGQTATAETHEALLKRRLAEKRQRTEDDLRQAR